MGPRHTDQIRVVQDYDGVPVERVYTPGRYSLPPEEFDALPEEERRFYVPYAPITQRTYEPAPGIVCEQDAYCTLRDGTRIYADIYRPQGEGPFPVIVSWSSYGKRPFDFRGPHTMRGVPMGTISDMAKDEAPDPGFWCYHGYAVANVDPRGVGNSEGNVEFVNSQEGRDGYDFVEWIAAQPWCNGRVGMQGNSNPAMVQWRIAATNPPHLACICPWEGMGDMYRQSMAEGGIPGVFGKHIAQGLKTKNYVDNQWEMLKLQPNADSPYWQDTIPRYEDIRCAVYAAAGWLHFHLLGSIEGFQRAGTPNKWLRIHREQEWNDAYQPANLADELLFCDRYLKGIHNGWEETPRVRMDVMDAYAFDYQTNRPEDDFPLARTRYERLHLDARDGSMAREAPAAEASVSYDAQTGEATFTYTFEQDTELSGYLWLRLWVEADGHDDMDLFVNVRKLSTTGEWLPLSIIGQPHPGAWGKLRASRRHLDPERTTEVWPYHTFDRTEKLEPGQVVPVDIDIWPTSWIWHAGQKIQVQVAGRYIRDEAWFEPLRWETNNAGRHVIHTGGAYDSWLQVPVVPPRYADGGYVYR